MNRQPLSFHLLAKPAGAACNLGCQYCFFLSKEQLYPNESYLMDDATLATYIRQLMESSPGPQVDVAWQGGEPLLRGLDFYKRSVELANFYRKPHHQRVLHTIQTNGTLITDEWAAFFKRHNFLVGISIDGPRALHDVYRVTKKNEGSFDDVIRGWTVLRQHSVDVNILCAIHAANADHPLDVYRFFRDELGLRHVQLIPIVEQDDLIRSVDPVKWGEFLITVFEEWVRHDVGTVYVQMFDAALASWVGAPASMCIFGETCGNALALEHNGDLYSCDHFVDPPYLLGNILHTQMVELVASPQQRAFGDAKRDTLPRYCVECPVRFACNGECPKNRFSTTPDGEPGLNYLCAGYRSFFLHVDGVMRLMADRLRAGGFADEVMTTLRTAPRNEPCPCGSGKKYKHCCLLKA